MPRTGCSKLGLPLEILEIRTGDRDALADRLRDGTF